MTDGILSQVQVNGGMHPGNSGGPVTDLAAWSLASRCPAFAARRSISPSPAIWCAGLDGSFASGGSWHGYQSDNQVLLPVK